MDVVKETGGQMSYSEPLDGLRRRILNLTKLIYEGGACSLLLFSNGKV